MRMRISLRVRLRILRYGSPSSVRLLVLTLRPRLSPSGLGYACFGALFSDLRSQGMHMHSTGVVDAQLLAGGVVAFGLHRIF